MNNPVISSLLLLAFLLANAGCSNKNPPEPIFICHVAPDRGGAREAILLAVEEANATEDKVAGRPVAVLHPEVKDDADADRAAIRLITINRVAALLAGTSPASTEQLSRTAQQYGLPLVATASPVNGTLPPNGFSVGLSPTERGKTLARYLAANLKKPAVAIVQDNRVAANTGIVTAFVEAYRAAGGKAEQPLGYGTDKELADRLAELKKLQGGAVVFVGPATDFAKLWAMKPDRPMLFAGEETAFDVIVPGGGSTPVYRVTAFAIDPSLPRTKEFVDKYQGRFQRMPNAATALAYDSARVLFDAMRRAGGFQGAKVSEELRQHQGFRERDRAAVLRQGPKRPPTCVHRSAGKRQGTIGEALRPRVAGRVLPARRRRGTLLPVEIDGQPASNVHCEDTPMTMMAPPEPPLRVTVADDDTPRHLRQRFWQLSLTAITLFLTAWCFTLGWVPGILAAMVAKHVLVAILVMGLGVDQPRQVRI